MLATTCGWLLAGCGDDSGEDTQPEVDAGATAQVQVLVGALIDSDVKLGVIATDDRARLFFCGGPSSYAESTRWLEVDLDADSRFELDDAGWRLRGQIEGATLAGELERGELAAAAFSAERTRPDTLAGVYEGMDDCGRVGLIVTQLRADDEATAQGACVGPGHAPEQVNPILPIDLEEDGSIRVQLEDEDGERVARVAAAAGP